MNFSSYPHQHNINVTDLIQYAERFTCYLLQSGFLLGLFLNPEKPLICSSETSADFQQTTWLYIPKDRTLLNPTSSVIFNLYDGGKLN
jgi:hypothetical protein